MKLHPTEQADARDPTCKVRNIDGLSAVRELDPGLITGPLSAVWKDLIDAAVSIGYETGRSIVAAPYDFRLAPSMLQERDSFFSELKDRIEGLVSRQSRSGGRSAG
jgi:hypothetical protein